MPLVELRGVGKVYQLGSTQVEALANIDFQIKAQEFAAIWGPSGSGKTSLLNLIGLIDSPSGGEIYLGGERVDGLTDDELARRRNQKIGFIFQHFNLVPVLDALENIMLPLQIRGVRADQAKAKARSRLREVGLEDQWNKRPDKMSGGQRQRIAIARALVGDPALVIADEPTANLDSATSRLIVDLMRELNRRDQVTFIFSTHDPRLLEHVDRRVRLEDGRIVATE
ncbi:MAG TPA: ABC transporter ATP-binding protein [Candidatus Competibacter sp.]|nr:ABC transporter ATP-binding protein [Candidatus Competibacter sp.]HUM95568.1 ABC transporter ATP-binding protein [Candidatus Competibacter sp.]